MKDYRPISMCNVIYKTVACAITTRFRLVLGKIINPSHSAFIPGHLVMNNVLIGYECIQCLRHSKNKTGYAAPKLDMSKAYHLVEWNYLQKLMNKFGFNDIWTNLIIR